MNYLLDTNICIYLIKKHPPQVIARFKELSLGQVGISSVTLAELEYGVKKSQAQEKLSFWTEIKATENNQNLG
jgi:tRNA(fMet)-specific endonuclease VapC